MTAWASGVAPYARWLDATPSAAGNESGTVATDPIPAPGHGTASLPGLAFIGLDDLPDEDEPARAVRRVSMTVNLRSVDEFELIARCFRDRTLRRPDTVLGIGDDAALLDTGGLPFVHAGATVAFPSHGDATGVACRVFGAALLRLAARAARPRWVTLALTLEAADPDWLEGFSAAAAAVCEASGVELAGGDTTRGPGRATVFALGAGAALPRRPEPRPRAAAIGVRLSLTTADTPEHAIADLVSVCADLAGRGTEIHWCDVSNAGDRAGGDARAPEFLALTDDGGAEALLAFASRRRLAIARIEADA